MEQPHDALKQALLALENRSWTAIKQRDSRTAAELSEDPCLVIGAQGVCEMKREAFPAAVEQASYELHGFALEDVHIRPLSEDIVVLAYTVKEDLTVDGKKLEMKAFDSSIWIKRGDGWVCVVHSESPAGDPFGRH